MEKVMKKHRLFSKRSKRLITWLVVIVSLVVLTISYVTLRNLTFGNHSLVVHQKHRDKLHERRTNLVTMHRAQLVSYLSEDTVHLSGFLIKRDRPKFNLLLCHGFRGNKESLYRLVDSFTQANILLFDFRAHGQSEGDFTTIGFHEYQDVIASAKYLKEQTKDTPHLPLVILGLSMGGAAALKAAAVEPDICDGLIIDSAYASLYDVVRKTFTKYSGLPGFPFLPVMEFLLEHISGCTLRSMQPVEYARHVKKPIFFIHSCLDTHTSPRDTIHMHEAAGKSVAKMLWLGPAVEHTCLHREHPELYHRKVNHFVEKMVLKNMVAQTKPR